MSPTVSWKDFEQAEPQFAGRVQALFDARRHKTIATLRADGSPRISGIETEFAGGELRFGSMTGARKGTDLRRDPRFALHSASDDPVEGHERLWPGDAKIAGRAVAAGRLAARPGGRPVPRRHHRGGPHPPRRRRDQADRRILDPNGRAAPGRAGVASRSDDRGPPERRRESGGFRRGCAGRASRRCAPPGCRWRPARSASPPLLPR